MSNRRFYYFAVFVVSMVWYILWGYLIAERYRDVWAAYVLAIYLTGFLEIGIEKFFYVRTYKTENPITKDNTCAVAVVAPSVIAVVCSELAFLFAPQNRFIFAFCIVTLGAACYRLVYWLIARAIHKG